MAQIPDGPRDLYCPFWRDRMSKRCKTCPMWQQFRGTNKNTGSEVDEWRCAVSTLPMLMIETSSQVRQGAAATESFRNEMVRRADEARRISNSVHAKSTPLLIEEG